MDGTEARTLPSLDEESVEKMRSDRSGPALARVIASPGEPEKRHGGEDPEEPPGPEEVKLAHAKTRFALVKRSIAIW
jgi:hypothetical protein